MVKIAQTVISFCANFWSLRSRESDDGHIRPVHEGVPPSCEGGLDYIGEILGQPIHNIFRRPFGAGSLLKQILDLIMVSPSDEIISK